MTLPDILFAIWAVFCLLAVIVYSGLEERPHAPVTRDILLTVPEESSVDAQVTSGNNTVNLQNL